MSRAEKRVVPLLAAPPAAPLAAPRAAPLADGVARGTRDCRRWLRRRRRSLRLPPRRRPRFARPQPGRCFAAVPLLRSRAAASQPCHRSRRRRRLLRRRRRSLRLLPPPPRYRFARSLPCRCFAAVPRGRVALAAAAVCSAVGAARFGCRRRRAIASLVRCRAAASQPCRAGASLSPPPSSAPPSAPLASAAAAARSLGAVPLLRSRAARARLDARVNHCGLRPSRGAAVAFGHSRRRLCKRASAIRSIRRLC